MELRYMFPIIIGLHIFVRIKAQSNDDWNLNFDQEISTFDQYCSGIGIHAFARILHSVTGIMKQ